MSLRAALAETGIQLYHSLQFDGLMTTRITLIPITLLFEVILLIYS